MDLPNLPNMEEYFSDLFKGYSNNQYSKPLFQCPVCKVGEVHRDDTVILASYPPKNLYKCFNCGKEFYR